MLKERVALADGLEKYVGKYFSQEYIRKFVFKQSEKEIKDLDKQIGKEGISSAIDNIGKDSDDTETPKKTETLL
jgi:hypothetical protein